MTDQEFDRLAVGDLIRHKGGSKAYVVQANYGSYVIAVRVAHVTNPTEWDLIGKAMHDPYEKGLVRKSLKD